MWHEELREELEAKHVDDDLEFLILDHFQEIGLSEIKDVLAMWEGSNDGDEWRWIIERTNGRFYFYTAGCDYTGWG